MPGKLEMHGGAKTMRWNIMEDIGDFTTALTEDVITQDPGNKIVTITTTGVLATVSDYGAWSPVSDLGDSVWTAETRQEYADIFAFAGAKTRDSLLRNAGRATTNFLIAGRTAVYAGALTTVSTTSTCIAQDLNVIRGFFDQEDCEAFDGLGGNYVVVIHGKQEQDMVGDVTTGRLSWSPLIQNVPAGADRIMGYKGPGILLGCAVQRSNNMTVLYLTASTTPAGTTTTTVYAGLALAEGGIGKTTLDQSEPRVILKRPGPTTISVPLDTYGTIGFKLRQAQRNLHVTRSLVYYSV
jgi:N4-gp56 family major capsid protein